MKSIFIRGSTGSYSEYSSHRAAIIKILIKTKEERKKKREAPAFLAFENGRFLRNGGVRVELFLHIFRNYRMVAPSDPIHPANSKTKRESGKKSPSIFSIFQVEHALLCDTGRDNVRVYRRNVVADGIQEGRIDVQGMAAVRLFLAVVVSHCVRAPVDRIDIRIHSPCGLRWSDMWVTGAYLLSDRNNSVPFKKNCMRSGYPSGLRSPAQLYIRVSFVNVTYT